MRHCLLSGELWSRALRQEPPGDAMAHTAGPNFDGALSSDLRLTPTGHTCVVDKCVGAMTSGGGFAPTEVRNLHDQISTNGHSRVSERP